MESNYSERISLRAIAEKANVSRMTVSRALRNEPAIADETRRRIRELARELGYRPNPEVVRVMETIRIRKRENGRHVIAYVTAHESRGAWRHHQTQRLTYEGAVRRAAECGYRLEEFWANEPGMTDARLSEIIHARGIEGVIIAPLPAPRLVLQDFRWDRFSCVEVGYSLARPALHRVCSHHFQSIMLLEDRLRVAGYARIGLAMDYELDQRVRHHWRAGHLTAHNLHGDGGAPLMFVSTDWNRTAFAGWLRTQNPDVIVTIGPQVGRWLRELDIRAPHEIGLANVDIALDAAGTSGIDQSPNMIGTAAIDLVVALLHHRERGVPPVPRVTKVQGTFLQGKTTRPILDAPVQVRSLGSESIAEYPHIIATDVGNR